MQEYQKKIYEFWGEKHPFSFSPPDSKAIQQQADFYREFIIKKTFPKNKEAKVLDIGCGYGIFLKACQDSGYEKLFGVDIIKECAEFIKEKFGIKTISQQDIVDYLKSRNDEEFDVISAIDVIEHFKKEEVLDLLKLIRSKLKKGGMFVMRVPNAGSMSGLYTFYSDITHETAFTSFLVNEIFSLVDFSKIKILPEYNPKNVKSLSLYLIQALASKVSNSLRNRYIFSGNIIAIGYK